MCNINFQKLHRPKHRKRVGTEEYVVVVDELVLSQQDQLQIHRLVPQVAQAGVMRVICLSRYWSEMFSRDVCKELTEANRYTNLAAQSCC